MNAAVQRWFGSVLARERGESRPDHLLRLLVSTVILLFPACCMLVDRSDSWSLGLLSLVGLWVWVRHGFAPHMSRDEWLFVAAFALFFLGAVLSFHFGTQTDAGFRLLGRYLRLMFVFPTLLALRRYRPTPAVVWAGLGFGALALGADAVWELVQANGFLRADGDTNVAILFGDLATLTTFAFAAGYLYIDGRLPRLGPWLMAAGVLVGLLASFLSGTRGAWLAVPVLIILFLACRHVLRPRAVFIGGGATLVLFGLLYFLPQTHIRERISGVFSEIESYRAVTQDIHRGTSGVQCLDRRDVLTAWIGGVKLARMPGVELDVREVKGPAAVILRGAGCTGAGVSVVYIHNGTPHSTRLTLLRAGRETTGTTSTTLLARGRGTIGFTAARANHIRVRSREFRRVRLSGPAQHSGRVRVSLPPRATLYLLPLESYAGEYRYALMHSSTAQRLEMWHAAGLLFKEEPLLGVGSGAYQVRTRELVEAGAVAPLTAQFDHPHSEFFHALAERGLLGLVALLALLGVPGWLYLRAVQSRDTVRAMAGMGGLLVVTGFAIFGFTETMFVHSVTLTWYVIMAAVFMVLADVPLRDATIRSGGSR